MRKMYKQPESSVEELMPQSIICTSTGYGGDSENIEEPEIIIP